MAKSAATASKSTGKSKSTAASTRNGNGNSAAKGTGTAVATSTSTGTVSTGSSSKQSRSSPSRPKLTPPRKKKQATTTTSGTTNGGSNNNNNNKTSGTSTKTKTKSTAAPVLENGVDLRRVYTLPSKGLDSADVVNAVQSVTAPVAQATKHRLDRFGFITNMDSHGVVHEPNYDNDDNGDGQHQYADRIPSFIEAQRTERREKKWKSVISSWPTFQKRRHKLVVQRLRKGIPDSQRGQVWALLGDLPAKIKANPGLYLRLVQQSAASATNDGVEHSKSFRVIQDTIERDIHRTYPRHAMFYDDTDPDESNDGVITTTKPSPSSSASMPARGGGSKSGSGRHMAASVDDDDEDVGLCGTREISTMIRELEFSNTTTSKGNPAVVAAATAAAAKKSYNRESRELTPQNVVDLQGGQPSLRRVLKAYSLYDREIGYCQGMNFIAGMFLTLMSEEESFWLLVAIMHDKPCEMRGLFGEGMRETHKVLYVAEKLIYQFLPKVAKHLEKEHIHITMFATQWLLTQYTSSFKFDMVTRIWDCFLGEGWKITYRVMLAMLSQWQNSLLKMSFEDILAFFRELPDSVDGQKVMEIAMKIPLRKKHIVKLEKEWEAQNPPDQS